MKKIIKLFVSLILILFATSCGNSNKSDKNTSSSAKSKQNSSVNEEMLTASSADSQKENGSLTIKNAGGTKGATGKLYNPIKASEGGQEKLNGVNYIVHHDDGSESVYELTNNSDLEPSRLFVHNGVVYATSMMAYYDVGNYNFFPRVVYDQARANHYFHGGEIKRLTEKASSDNIVVTSSGCFILSGYSPKKKILNEGNIVYTTLRGSLEEQSKYDTHIILAYDHLRFYKKDEAERIIQFESKLSSYYHKSGTIIINLENDNNTYYYPKSSGEEAYIVKAPGGYSYPSCISHSNILYKNNSKGTGASIVRYSYPKSNKPNQIIDLDIKDIQFVKGNESLFFVATKDELYVMALRQGDTNDLLLSKKKVADGAFTLLSHNNRSGSFNSAIFSTPDNMVHAIIVNTKHPSEVSDADVEHYKYQL